MKKRKRLLSAVLLGILLLMTILAVGCSGVPVPLPNGPDDPPDENQLAAVNAASVSFYVTSTSFVVSWTAVPNATSYEVSYGNAKTTVAATTVDLRKTTGFSLPTSGKITIKIIAKGDGYKDSAPTSKTYNTEEGTQLRSPEIISFNNGVIAWNKDSGVSAFVIKVNGTLVSDNYTQTTYSVSSLFSSARIEIAAKNSNGVGPATAVNYDYSAKKLRMLPVSNYTLEGEVLKWGEVDGAIGYKVVDLDFNAYTVQIPHYIMTLRNVLYGVYPIMPDDAVVQSAAVEAVDIPYLSGSGTAANPYLIKTPFDLRTVDYYELRYGEEGGSKNYYKIDADMNYQSVAALEGDSNVFTLRKPFYGVLDGNGKKLSNFSVTYRNGFWALFEHVAQGGEIRNITFSSPEINNGVQDSEHPINPAIATVAYRNYGVITGITVNNARYTATAGSIAGIAVHNFGTVSACTLIGCTFTEGSTSNIGSAAYEMAGVVLENNKGGSVTGCSVKTLTVKGTGTNVGTTGGIVSVNRKGGILTNNSFDGVTVSNLQSGKELGGIAGYTAVAIGAQGTLGTLTRVGYGTVSSSYGNASAPYGKLYGKQG